MGALSGTKPLCSGADRRDGTLSEHLEKSADLDVVDVINDALATLGSPVALPALLERARATDVSPALRESLEETIVALTLIAAPETTDAANPGSSN